MRLMFFISLFMMLALGTEGCGTQEAPQEAPESPQMAPDSRMAPGGDPEDSSTEAFVSAPSGQTQGTTWSASGRSSQLITAPAPSLGVHAGFPPSTGPAGSLYVIIGGNVSCDADQIRKDEPTKMPMFQVFLETFAPVAPAWIVSCYLNRSSQILYASSLRPDQVYTAHESQFATRIRQLAQRSGRALEIIGHSYGGWLAMKVALELSQTNQLNSLITLDPVSPINCPHSLMECTRAPTDISPAAKSQLQASTRLWANFYQSISVPNSSPIPAADINAKRFVTHGHIDDSRRIWQDIRKLILP